MRLSDISCASNPAFAVAAGAPALFAGSATTGIGAPVAGAIAAVACAALDDDAGCQASLVEAAAVLFVTITVIRISFWKDL
eukprot:2895757-Pyramimonas_sp.AAC.1